VLTRSQKETEVAELHDRFTRATSVFVAEYRGLNVASVDALRAKMRAAGGADFEYRVAKNTLLRRAAEGSSGASLVPHFSGPTAVAFSFGDPAKLAKMLVDYAKDKEPFQLRAAVVDGQPLDLADIAVLATLPSLDELRGKLIGLLQAPAGQLARLLAAPGAQIARVVGAHQRQMEAAGASE
jgi:large subunit ribosomal protein L10